MAATAVCPSTRPSLVATLAPDRAILIDTNLNDYNDGAMTDNMSLEIAKGVYQTLGANGDKFVKFNSGNYVSRGDPHGSAGAAVEGKYPERLLLRHANTDRRRSRPAQHRPLLAKGLE